MIQPAPWHWFAFIGAVVALAVLDLRVFHAGAQLPSWRKSLAWTMIWFVLAISFGGVIWRFAGAEAAARYTAGYLIEWSLSMDNLLVFAIVFAQFHITQAAQYRVLFWGILGAMVMRLAIVLLGAQLIATWDWVLPLLGLLIVYLGAQFARGGHTRREVTHHPLFRLVRLFSPMLQPDYGARLMVRVNGKWRPTQLMAVLVLIECLDVVFAIDSVPAVFGVSRDPFIVFSSNIMALLGLRAMYFLLAGLLDRFRRLHAVLGCVLVFVGATMVAEYSAKQLGYVSEGHELIPYWATLLVIVGLLAGGVAYSMWSESGKPSENPPTDTLPERTLPNENPPAESPPRLQ
jgi:tellurite resistance protein TerC